MFKEFKEFISRGNVLDLAVGVIIGGAFGKIVTSLVDDIIMPFIGLIIGGLDFSGLSIVIRKATRRIKPEEKEEEPVVEAPSKEEALLAEIRDLLKAKN